MQVRVRRVREFGLWLGLELGSISCLRILMVKVRFRFRIGSRVQVAVTVSSRVRVNNRVRLIASVKVRVMVGIRVRVMTSE